MKTITHFIIFSIAILLFSACKDVVNSNFECLEEGEYLGIKHLSEKTDSFWSYQNNQTRVYLNSAGNEFLFNEYLYEPYEEKVIELPIKYLCNSPNAEPEYDYFDIEYRKVRYQSPNISALLSIRLEVRPIFKGDSIYFVDLLTLTNRSSEMFVIDSRNTPDEFISYRQFDFTPNITLLNKTFQNVYYQELEPFSVFYTKEQGVVAFYDMNESLYVLDRIE